MRNFYLNTILLLFSFIACKEVPEEKLPEKNKNTEQSTPEAKDPIIKKAVVKEEVFRLNDENAIPFFQTYAKENTENKVRITTRFGSFDILLFDNVPYHRANFIYLTKKEYFNSTYFHRVVKDFIIQGGNADNSITSKNRAKIGKYLLPPDTKKGHKPHYGVVSVPSSDIDNPHKLASPYEFFIVQNKKGAYHLDGDYTAFGKVIRGMKVVDKIAAQPTDGSEWPKLDIPMKVEIIN